MQVDGEPCRLAPAMIRISLRNQANMVQKSKRRTSMPLLNEWVCPCPPLWTWRPWRGGHWACAWSGASLCWERRRVQETQQLLGLLHIFLLHVYYTVTTRFFQKLLLYDVLEWWRFFTDHLSIYLLGPAENHWVIQGRKTCPVERVLFCLRRRAVGLLFSPVAWRVLVSPGAGGRQSWLWLPSLHIVSPPALSQCSHFGVLCTLMLQLNFAILGGILLSRWNLTHDSMPKQNVSLLDPFLSWVFW